LQILTAEFTQPYYNNTVLTIELINEPNPYSAADLSILQQYYQTGYASVRSASQQEQIVVALDDGFQGLQTWEGFMTEPEYSDVAMDTVSPSNYPQTKEPQHVYSVFDLDLLQMGYNANLKWICSQQNYLKTSNQVHWTIVGEFTRKWLHPSSRTDP
jgi:glucan 1,3-beta-glucosidase